MRRSLTESGYGSVDWVVGGVTDFSKGTQVLCTFVVGLLTKVQRMFINQCQFLLLLRELQEGIRDRALRLGSQQPTTESKLTAVRGQLHLFTLGSLRRP